MALENNSSDMYTIPLNKHIYIYKRTELYYAFCKAAFVGGDLLVNPTVEASGAGVA